MTFYVLLVMVGIAIALTWRNFWRLSLVFYSMVVLAFLFVGSGLPAHWLLTRLQDGYGSSTAAWGAHNAIVLLGAGSELTKDGPELSVFSYGRLVKAFDLYRSCKAQAADCRIVSSGGDTHRYGKSEAELYTTQLERLGAVPADLIAEKRSMNTWQNAQFTAAILAGQKPDRVVLVTSGLHLQRSELYFAHFGLQPVAVRADYARAPMSVLPNAYNFFLTDLALHEYMGVLRYYIYNLLGLNVRPVRPGAL